MAAGLIQGRHLSLVEAAEWLGVSPHTLRVWARYQRRIAYVRAGRRILFSPADLTAFVAANRVEARKERGQ